MQLTGCLDCSAAAEDVIRADQTTTVATDGEVSGKAVPAPTGVSAEYEFDDYQLPANKLSRLERALAEIDFAALADRHPPTHEEDVDSRLAYTITYEGESYEIGDPLGENYDDPPRQAALFETIVGIVEDARTAGSGIDEELEEIPTLEEMLRGS
ncbi:MAG TPA: hypothetical protein VKA36_06305 [Solirubrobacterales bacterium]|nr:hypothetical protein [Solirubrobacterales bacterium]